MYHLSHIKNITYRISYIIYHISYIIYHIGHSTYHISYTIYKIPYIIYHISYIMYHISYIPFFLLRSSEVNSLMKGRVLEEGEKRLSDNATYWDFTVGWERIRDTKRKTPWKPTTTFWFLSRLYLYWDILHEGGQRNLSGFLCPQMNIKDIQPSPTEKTRPLWLILYTWRKQIGKHHRSLCGPHGLKSNAGTKWNKSCQFQGRGTKQTCGLI